MATTITKQQSDALTRQKAGEAVPREQWMTHDELIAAISILYPNAVHGRDFYVAHMVEPQTNAQLSSAFVAQWSIDGVPEPSLADLMQAVAPHVNSAKATVCARDVRWERNARLDRSDVLFTRAMEDENTAQVAALKTYRKALRDLPLQSGFPFNVDWPELPAEVQQ
ncbi:phage tail assembly chaperone [Paraburkholderia unamae]|uniref:Phage tail assembly chaperone n=1 Tax=Paraburkholderia unamae TaxID=219649 RepID=A0ACC6RPV8_9BURK